MSKASQAAVAAIRRYNEKTYKMYRIPIRKDSELFREVEKYMEENSISGLVQNLLLEHFGVQEEKEPK